MYNKILAPLDGSELAECSLGHVKAIATGCSVPEVVLFRVVEPIPAHITADLAEGGEMSAEVYTEIEKQNRAEADKYITATAKKLKRETSITIQAALAYGSPAEEILKYAKKNQVDLIIMTTHGRSGIPRWVFGSVADRVLRHSPVPILIMAPTGCR
ncbi:universal stress protein [Chloroflexota bacterium]